MEIEKRQKRIFKIPSQIKISNEIIKELNESDHERILEVCMGLSLQWIK